MKRLKQHWEIVVLILIFLLVKLAFALRFHNIIWDEAVYLSMAKSLFSFGDIGLWEMIRPPGLPLLLGVIWKFTPNYVFFAELLTNAFAAASIGLIYLMGKELHSKETGLLAAFFLAITPIFFLYSGYILTGIPSAFFIMLSMYLLFKRNFIWAGISAGVASQFRFPHGLFVVTAILAMGLTHYFIKNKHLIKNIKEFALSFGAIHIPFLIFNFFMYNAETSRIHHALFRPWILGSTHTQNPAEALYAPWVQKYFYYAINLFQQNKLLVFALLGLILYFTLKKFKDFKFNLLIVTLLFYAGFFSYIINKQLRFSIGFLYIVCLLAAFAIMYVVKELHKRKHFKSIKWTYVTTAAFLIIFMFSFASVIPENEKYLGYRFTAPPQIVTEFYQYFENNNIQSPVLTGDPVVAAYNDNLFIPIYYSLAAANKAYDEYKTTTGYLVYTNETFYCAPGADWCQDEALAFEQRISENTLVFNKTYGHPDVGFREYYIYRLTST